MSNPGTKKCLGEYFSNYFSCSTQNGTGLGGEGSGVGDQDRVGSPCVYLPATSRCTLGSSPVMVICDRRAGWSGPLQSSWTIVREGLVLDLEALGSQGQSAAQCPSWWHLWQAVLGDLSWLGHSLAQCPTCLQIRHLPRALSFKGSGCAIGLPWRVASIWAFLSLSFSPSPGPWPPSPVLCYKRYWWLSGSSHLERQQSPAAVVVVT